MNFDFLLESIKPTQTSTITIDATGALVFPAGNTAARPAGVIRLASRILSSQQTPKGTVGMCVKA